MWTWRNMKNICWKDHITDEYMLGQVNEKRKLLNTIFQKKKRWRECILRGKSLVKEVIQERMEGIMMLGDIKADETYEKVKRRAITLDELFLIKFKIFKRQRTLDNQNFLIRIYLG